MSWKHWTLEERQRQAERMRNWKPWEKSTGPKSAQGKHNVSRNGYKGGEWLKLRKFRKELNAYMREVQQNLG